MLIRSKHRKKPGTKIQLHKDVYVFVTNENGDDVCEVEPPEHIEIFLHHSGDAYEPYGEQAQAEYLEVEADKEAERARKVADEQEHKAKKLRLEATMARKKTAAQAKADAEKRADMEEKEAAKAAAVEEAKERKAKEAADARKAPA